MLKKARRCLFFGHCILVLLVLISVKSTGEPTSTDKLLSGMTNLGLNNTITSPLDVGFLPDEQLVSLTNTLSRPYYQDTITPEDELTNNNNLCESPSDAYVAEDWKFETAPECRGLWITWDSKNLYGAVQLFAQGKAANAFILFDTDPKLGTEDFTTMSSWQRELRFNGVKPDFFLGLYPDYKDNGTSGWYPDQTDGIQPSGARCGYQFRQIDQNGTLESTEYKDQLGAFTSAVRPWAGYTGRGADDNNLADNIVFFKIPWTILSSRVTSFVGLTNWTIKLCAATTGADSSPGTARKIYDWIPDSRYSVEKAAKLGIPSKQNNYLTIRVTDMAGAFRYPASLKDDAAINFYPGSIKDVANHPYGKFPFGIVDFNGNTVKAMAPHLGSQRIYFHMFLRYNTINGCSLRVYDIKGNVVRTIFSNKTFFIELGQKDVHYNLNPSVLADNDLSWDGTTDQGNVAPMGIYFIVFKGQDGTVDFTQKLPFMIVK